MINFVYVYWYWFRSNFIVHFIALKVGRFRKAFPYINILSNIFCLFVILFIICYYLVMKSVLTKTGREELNHNDYLYCFSG